MMRRWRFPKWASDLTLFLAAAAVGWWLATAFNVATLIAQGR